MFNLHNLFVRYMNQLNSKGLPVMLANALIAAGILAITGLGLWVFLLHGSIAARDRLIASLRRENAQLKMFTAVAIAAVESNKSLVA